MLLSDAYREMKRLISTGFGIGLVPVAPGTFASAAALVAAMLVYHAGGLAAISAATLIAALLGLWSISAESAKQDPPSVVIDEVAGQWVAVLPIAVFLHFGFFEFTQLDSVFLWIASFLLFRTFDIMKPWLIGRVDRRGGRWDVMIDDLLAGAFAAIAVFILGFAGILLQ